MSKSIQEQAKKRGSMTLAIEPFRIAIPDESLGDLRQRLQRARWPSEIGDNRHWQAGTNLAYMKQLVAWWLDGYDWRRHEAAMNAVPQFRTVIDEVPIHFQHIKGSRRRGDPNPMPLILTHGWPWTFWDWRKVIGPLSDPVAHGGDAADAFDVIVPSLPGFGFSSPLTKPGVFHANIADLWVKLMDRLGYGRFAAHGADIGAFVTGFLGHRHPDKLIGIHLQHLVPLRPPLAAPEDYSEQEKPAIAKRAEFMANGSGYAAIQRTRPQTIAYGMHDSPIGLAAWLIEKRRSWADSAGDIESVFSKDDLLTTVCLYWFTDTYLSSAHHYYEPAQKSIDPGFIHDRRPLVEVPVAGLQFLGDIIYHPRKWVETHYNLQKWRVEEKGGHFGAAEKPKVVVDDLREFFRPWR